MRDGGLVTTISAGWAVAAVWISGAIDFYSFQLAFGEEMTRGTAVAIAVLDGISIVIVAWLLLHVQGNLNSYWRHISEGRATSARIGLGGSDIRRRRDAALAGNFCDSVQRQLSPRSVNPSSPICQIQGTCSIIRRGKRGVGQQGAPGQ